MSCFFFFVLFCHSRRVGARSSWFANPDLFLICECHRVVLFIARCPPTHRYLLRAPLLRAPYCLLTAHCSLLTSSHYLSPLASLLPTQPSSTPPSNQWSVVNSVSLKKVTPNCRVSNGISLKRSEMIMRMGSWISRWKVR